MSTVNLLGAQEEVNRFCAPSLNIGAIRVHPPSMNKLLRSASLQLQYSYSIVVLVGIS